MGLQAIAVQHELDHMNGKLIVDHHIAPSPIHKSDAKVGRISDTEIVVSIERNTIRIILC